MAPKYTLPPTQLKYHTSEDLLDCSKHPWLARMLAFEAFGKYPSGSTTPCSLSHLALSLFNHDPVADSCAYNSCVGNVSLPYILYCPILYIHEL